VTLKPYVHLQGAGRKATILSSAVSSSADPPDRATVVLADETSLRDLTVKNEGTGAHNVAVLLTGTDKQAELANVYAETFSSGEVTAYAIYVRGTWAHLTATDVAAYGASGGDSYGLYSAANATLVGGQFRGRFGASAYGVHHVGSELVAEGATFEANDGAETIALYNEGWRARVHGGEVYAKGGGDTWGIYNANDGTLEVQDVTLYSEGSLLVASPSQYAYGLENNGATAILRGGKYHAYGGEAFTAGLRNVNSDAELEAYGVVAEGGAGPSYDNVYGLLNAGGASAVLRGGSYLAEGGRYTNGLKNSTVTSVIDAHGITAEARDGAIENHALDAGTSSTTDVRSSALVGDTALLLDNCTVHLAMTQLAGTISRTGGTLTCYGVYNASYAGIGCP
jgi:hypothetical protein